MFMFLLVATSPKIFGQKNLALSIGLKGAEGIGEVQTVGRAPC